MDRPANAEPKNLGPEGESADDLRRLRFEFSTCRCVTFAVPTVLFCVISMPSASMRVLGIECRPESMTMLLHPLPDDTARLPQCSGGEREAHSVASLLDAAHSLAVLFLRGAVRLCGAELRLQGIEIGSSKVTGGVVDPEST